jgi:hypothetical protein
MINPLTTSSLPKIRSRTKMPINRVDRVSIFNEKLTFLIPHEWVEVESGEDGTYTYQLPNATSGFFRVSLITARGPLAKLRSSFEERHGRVDVNPSTGNFVAQSEKPTTQDGERIHIYYWYVGGPVAPDLNREAVFSYTVLADLVNDSETQLDVGTIGKLASDASFDHPA